MSDDYFLVHVPLHLTSTLFTISSKSALLYNYVESSQDRSVFFIVFSEYGMAVCSDWCHFKLHQCGSPCHHDIWSWNGISVSIIILFLLLFSY